MSNTLTKMTTHCWHLAEVQHMSMHHRDVTCCWCGESRCLTADDAESDHGPYYEAPDTFTLPAEPCPERQR